MTDRDREKDRLRKKGRERHRERENVSWFYIQVKKLLKVVEKQILDKHKAAKKVRVVKKWRKELI